MCVCVCVCLCVCVCVWQPNLTLRTYSYAIYTIACWIQLLIVSYRISSHWIEIKKMLSCTNVNAQIISWKLNLKTVFQFPPILVSECFVCFCSCSCACMQLNQAIRYNTKDIRKISKLDFHMKIEEPQRRNIFFTHYYASEWWRTAEASPCVQKWRSNY